MDLSYYENKNSENYFLDSEIPSVCKEDPCTLGIDEAGRGPVLGPMVYAVCFCPLEKENDLKQLGAADSKTLTEAKREELFDLIHKNNQYIGWSLKIISPLSISKSMYKRPKVSLNEVSHTAAAELVQRVLDSNVTLKNVYVDTVGDPQKYQSKLEGLFPTLNITVSKKADALFPCVSAASICAKVARDRSLKSWKFPEELSVESWGSGYPGDNVTQNFLMNSLDPIFGFPGLVRFSWSTAEKIMDEKCAPVKWFDEEEDEKKENTPSVLEYFTKKRKSTDDAKPVKKPPPRRHYFFADRYLKHLDSF